MTDNKIKVKAFMQPSFLICVTLLLLACVGKVTKLDEIIERSKKIPIDLRKSFDEMDENQLTPYSVISKQKIENLEVVESLGTEDYIQWVLEDTEVSEKSAARYCSLFITYYGKPDRVPHVPDECYIGSGYQRKGARYITLNIDEQRKPFDARLLVFGRNNMDALSIEPDFSRMYFFKVNNDFACTRMGVRAILGKNISGDHSYFSKVEWEFFGMGMGSRIRPSDEHNLAASEKLMSKFLPLLENEHWPKLDEPDTEENNEIIIINESEEKLTP